MLATLVIGLREGLEASLIVGIIAAFLNRNHQSMRPMWIGVLLAILISLLVGVGLHMVEKALSQAQQEALETLIGVVAIFFVTGMIAWMNSQGGAMRGELEARAAASLSKPGSYALASMAFLAVLKEGFETSVFLLATFSVAQSAAWAAVGATLGLLLSVVIGWGIYIGGVKINLSRFFRITGAFLILVAAGLCVSTLRTAHEAGWLNAGQQQILDLSWLVAAGTMRSALITGMLGIPSDPRLIEGLGWCLYLVPVALFIYWPQSHRPGLVGAGRIKIAVALLCLAVSALLFLLSPTPSIRLPNTAARVMVRKADVASASLSDQGALVLARPDNTGKLTLPLPQSEATRGEHDGLASRLWDIINKSEPSGLPQELTYSEIVKLSGGRKPIGLNPTRYPGPYHVSWVHTLKATVWTTNGILLDASGRNALTMTLSDGGLQSPRTLSVRSIQQDLKTDLVLPVGRWHVSEDHISRVQTALIKFKIDQDEWMFWARTLPSILAFISLFLALFGARNLVQARRLAPERFHSNIGQDAEATAAKGHHHAA
ncbi:high-affinity iron transporter [Cohaesibacter sp. ES.047]|uniref:iron uptake transporter permease EfeU n=1 Tax=Cohaesibacter sp. ES.047 TaxID=1798205 RepID=UPI000BBFC594|nr:iron uptake transporter permease EfeU [Cohaesibacter sp. ES.047]SNY92360.1 high-affinity iron transporter [Cohaesibacter sp. ES.047]